MAMKLAFLIMSPDGDPKKHRTTITTPKLEFTTVAIESMNIDQAVDVCKDLVQNKGVQGLMLCPGFSHQAVAKVSSAVGPGIAIDVARGDVPSGRIISGIMAAEGWIPK
jgi:hypothetical protein